MNKILIFAQAGLVCIAVSMASNAAAETNLKAKNLSDVTATTSNVRPTNVYGWNDSNCAHITAKGGCVHPIGPNYSRNPGPPAYGWNASNCAHITAGGGCAHPLVPTLSNRRGSRPYGWNSSIDQDRNGWNSSNCAHITADGGCAHPL